MSKLELKRTYVFTDCNGGGSEDPLTAPDSDAQITQDLRSFAPESRHREFDTYWSPAITDHILRTVLRIHKELEERGDLTQADREAAGITGVLINSAPRTEIGKNGEVFYLAELFGNRIRVVAYAPALAAVKGHIENLSKLPNEGNGLFGDGEQFRSSFAGTLLRPDHKVELQSAALKDIPEPPKGWRVSYVDRFGNLVTHDSGEVSGLRRLASLRIGGVIKPVVSGSSLGESEPGSIVVYPNDEDIEVLRKWKADENPRERLEKSAFSQFGKPGIGAWVEANPRPPVYGKV